MSYENLMKAFESVEDNNRINDGQWSDWTDASHIIEVYEIGELSVSEREILNKAISGMDFKADLEALEFAEWGTNFSNGRVDHALASAKK